MKIMRPQMAHFEAVCEVYALSIRDAFEKESLGHLEDVMADEILFKRELMTRYLKGEDEERLHLIALIEDEVVGAISFGPCGKEIQECTDIDFPAQGELGGLYIKPTHQNKGIGSKLIHEMANEMKKIGVQTFALDSGYKRAQKRWCNKFGPPYLVVKDYWGPGGDHMIWLCDLEVFMSKRLG